MADDYEVTEWRQGHLLNEADATRLFPEHAVDNCAKVLVISHDCDLSRPPNFEPIVEVILGRKRSKLDGNFTHGKNSRKLQLSISGGDIETYMELEARSKRSFEKHVLPKLTPDTSFKLTAEERTILQAWLAARYRRAAYPDAFNDRISNEKIGQKLSTKLASFAQHLVGLYIYIEQDFELEKVSDNYDLDIIVLWNDDGSFDVEEKIKNLCSDITAIFKDAFFDENTKKWSGIELKECIDVTDHAMSIYMLRRYQRWNADHLSLRAVPQQPIQV